MSLSHDRDLPTIRPRTSDLEGSECEADRGLEREIAGSDGAPEGGALSAKETGVAMTSDRFLTRAWNNQLTLLLGLPTLAWAVVALATPVFSDLTAFIGMVVLAAVY